MRWASLRPAIGRDIDGGFLFENFLVMAIGSILAIRVYLELTGYPQIGGGGLHIAHMLWGGFFLLIALILLFTFLGKWAKFVGAILGGIGFGTFIDELGKFITSDNNYFYRPTFALIYVIFILLFLAFRAIERRQPLSREEYLANALESLQEAALGKMTADKRDQVLRLLRSARQDLPLAKSLEAALAETDWLPAAEPGVFSRTRTWSRNRYQQLLGARWFHFAILVIFGLHAAGFLLDTILTIVQDPAFSRTNLALTFEDIGQLFSSTLASLCVVIGVVFLRVSRFLALLWFKRSVLLTIFLVMFFSFYSEQLLAFLAVVLNIVLLVGLDYMLGELRRAEHPDATAPAPAGPPQAAHPRRAGELAHP